jgi:hypothetical protein
MAGLRIGAIIVAMLGVLWTVNQVRSAGRLAAEVELLRSENTALIGRAQALVEAASNKEVRTRTVVKRFVEYRERAAEVVDAECDPKPLDDTYVAQLRAATNSAAGMSDGTAGLAGTDGDSSAITVYGRRIEDVQPVHD